MDPAENLASTSARAALPNFSRKAASPASFSMASAKAVTSSTDTVSAVFPSIAISRQPGASVATMARPQAAASSRLFGKPSRREASTAKCARLHTSRISATWPSERLDQNVHALVGEHAPDIGGGDRWRRLGQGREQLGVDSRTRNENHGLLRCAKRNDEGAVVGILHHGFATRSPQQMSEGKAHGPAADLAHFGLANEQRAEAGHAIHYGRIGEPEACRGAKQNGLERYIMENVRIELVEKTPELKHRREAAERREATAAPRECVRGEALLLDDHPALLDPRCNMDVVAGGLRRAGHGQPVRQEVPILCDDVEQAGGGHGWACSSGIYAAKQKHGGRFSDTPSRPFPAFSPFSSWHHRQQWVSSASADGEQ